MNSSQNPGRNSRRPCTVGLTGGLASGKSSVSKILAGRDIPVLDADAVVHRLYEPGEPGARAVAEIFGSAVLDEAGAVDRRILGGRVLRDRDLRLALENAIHPLVRQEIARWIDGLVDTPVAVVEAALLVETGSYRSYDVLLVVFCTESQQLERAVSRGVPEDRARSLLDAQTPLVEKRAVADVVIDNGGPVEDLETATDRALADIEILCMEGRSEQSRENS